MTESKRLYTILITCLMVIANDSDIEATAIGEGLIIRVMDRMVYVDLGLQDNIKKGDLFNIIEPEVFTHPLDGDTLSVSPKNIGALRVIQVFPKMALAEVTHIESPKDPMLKHIAPIQDALRIMEVEHFEKMAVANRQSSKSLLIPGLYQYQYGDKRKGFGLLGAEVMAMVVGIGYRMSSNDWNDQYRNLGPGASRADFDFYHKEADRRRTVSNRAFFVAGALYAYNLFDVLWMQDNRFPLSIDVGSSSDDIAMLKLKRHF